MPNPRTHHRSRIGALLAAALAAGAPACASLKRAEAPGCEGPRRPANPHGSVLDPDAPAAATADVSPSLCGGTAP